MSSGALPQLVLPESGKSAVVSERNLERSCRKQTSRSLDRLQGRPGAEVRCE